MTTVELISFIASVASLILAVGAIWLSVVFYKMSVAASNATTEAAKGIGASVERLEKLFDKLYSDTFSMMRDTVSDMRKHMWPTDGSEADKTIEEAEKKADEKISEVKKGVETQLSELLERQKMSDDRVSAIRAEMRHLIDRAIVGSRQAETEAREETIREHILRQLRVLRRRQPLTTLEELVDRLGLPPQRIFRELERMKAEDIVALSGEFRPDTQVRLKSLREARDEG